MENTLRDTFLSGTLSETKMQTALIRREACSMGNGGGGRFQLLSGVTGALDGIADPAGADGPASAQAGETAEGQA